MDYGWTVTFEIPHPPEVCTEAQLTADFLFYFESQLEGAFATHPEPVTWQVIANLLSNDDTYHGGHPPYPKEEILRFKTMIESKEIIRVEKLKVSGFSSGLVEAHILLLYPAHSNQVQLWGKIYRNG